MMKLIVALVFLTACQRDENYLHITTGKSGMAPDREHMPRLRIRDEADGGDPFHTHSATNGPVKLHRPKGSAYTSIPSTAPGLNAMRTRYIHDCEQFTTTHTRYGDIHERCLDTVCVASSDPDRPFGYMCSSMELWR